jgi:tetratricopeptide (TPR) repeat protein
VNHSLLWLALGLACQSPTPPQVSEAKPVFVETPAPSRSETFVATLSRLDAAIGGHERRVAERPKQALREKRLAEALLQRSRLTGDYSDYARAQIAIEAAFAKSPPDTGPFLARASLNYSLHRLDRVEADLHRAESAILVASNTQASIVQMRANLLLQSGQAVAAEALYREALQIQNSPQGLSALAICLSRQERWAQAEVVMDEATAAYYGKSVRPLAWAALHKGLFDLTQGQLDQALVHYEYALAVMPGWWLVQEHVAEIAVLQGRDLEALKTYQDIVRRTGHPEFMDAIAGILARQGDAVQARVWRLRAREVYEGQLVRFPEAAAGHALQHFLDAGDSPERAVALAEANVAIRPNAEALTLLARAYEAAGRTGEAKQARVRAQAVD